MTNPIADLKHELIAAAERQHRHGAVAKQPRRFGGRVIVTRTVVVAATLTVAAAAALFLTASWSSSPSFLARAEAALTPPKGTILHVKLAETVTPDVSCDHWPAGTTWTAEIWVDERTHRFRGVFRDPFGPYPFRYFKRDEIGEIPCMRGSAWETGGIVGVGALRFVPPNRLVPYPIAISYTVKTLDPVADLRLAIRAGRAHREARTQLRGRTVERIRFDPCEPRLGTCPAYLDLTEGQQGYAYVNPKTFYPVEIRLPGDVTQFITYEYLPRTAANFELTSIRAQHPHARG